MRTLFYQIAIGGLIAVATAGADIIFQENFDTAPTVTEQNTNSKSTSAMTVTDWNYRRDITPDVSGGDLSLNNNRTLSSNGLGTFINLFGATPGDYTLSFNVSGMTGNGVGYGFDVKLYEGNDLTAFGGSSEFDVTLGLRNSDNDQWLVEAATGSGTVSLITGDSFTSPADDPFTGNSTFKIGLGPTSDYSFSKSFTLTEGGVAGDFLVLSFNGFRSGGGSNLVDIDNIVIETAVIPEPSTLVLSVLALAGLAYARRRMG